MKIHQTWVGFDHFLWLATAQGKQMKHQILETVLLFLKHYFKLNTYQIIIINYMLLQTLINYHCKNAPFEHSSRLSVFSY